MHIFFNNKKATNFSYKIIITKLYDQIAGRLIKTLFRLRFSTLNANSHIHIHKSVSLAQ